MLCASTKGGYSEVGRAGGLNVEVMAVRLGFSPCVTVR